MSHLPPSNSSNGPTSVSTAHTRNAHFRQGSRGHRQGNGDNKNKNSLDGQVFCLGNLENYNPCVMEEYCLFETVQLNYIQLISDYLLLFYETNKRLQEAPETADYFFFLFERGFKAVTYVFCLTLLHTYNSQMAFYHGQRAYYYYVEFLNQIMVDKHTFLKLSSRDAILFVYKKTVFEIMQTVRLDNNTSHFSKSKSLMFFQRMHTWMGRVKQQFMKGVHEDLKEWMTRLKNPSACLILFDLVDSESSQGEMMMMGNDGEDIIVIHDEF